MTKLADLVKWIAYILGLLAVVAALAVAFIPTLPNPIHVTSRGCLVFAITLFWGAIASHLLSQDKR